MSNEVVVLSVVTLTPQPGLNPCSLFVWLWLVVNDRKFSAGTLFFSHTNQTAVLLHEPATKRTSQPNMLLVLSKENKKGITKGS